MAFSCHTRVPVPAKPAGTRPATYSRAQPFAQIAASRLFCGTGSEIAARPGEANAGAEEQEGRADTPASAPARG
jgi:hypothetical protein